MHLRIFQSVDKPVIPTPVRTLAWESPNFLDCFWIVLPLNLGLAAK